MSVSYPRRLAAFLAGARTVRHYRYPQDGPQDPDLYRAYDDGRRTAHLLTGYHYADNDPYQETVPLLPFTAYRLRSHTATRSLVLATTGHPRCPECRGSGTIVETYRYAEDDDGWAEDIEDCPCTTPVLALPLPDTTPLRTAWAALTARLHLTPAPAPRPALDWDDEPPF